MCAKVLPDVKEQEAWNCLTRNCRYQISCVQACHYSCWLWSQLVLMSQDLYIETQRMNLYTDQLVQNGDLGTQAGTAGGWLVHVHSICSSELLQTVRCGCTCLDT